MAASAVFGCTGLVGSQILSTLLALEAFSTVQTISRRAPKSEGPKLQATIEPDSSQWDSKLKALAPAPTTVFSAVGTTRVDAGGIKNQWKIDHDLNVELAKAAKEAGVRTYVFVSSSGTRGFLASQAPYCKMKNGVEDSIKELGFDHAVILRPGLIVGERESSRAIEVASTHVLGGLKRLFGQGFRDGVAQDAEVIARAAVHAAQLANEGKAPEKYWILEQRDIVRLGRDEWKH